MDASPEVPRPRCARLLDAIGAALSTPRPCGLADEVAAAAAVALEAAANGLEPAAFAGPPRFVPKPFSLQEGNGARPPLPVDRLLQAPSRSSMTEIVPLVPHRARSGGHRPPRRLAGDASPADAWAYPCLRPVAEVSVEGKAGRRLAADLDDDPSTAPPAAPTLRLLPQYDSSTPGPPPARPWGAAGGQGTDRRRPQGSAGARRRVLMVLVDGARRRHFCKRTQAGAGGSNITSSR